MRTMCRLKKNLRADSCAFFPSVPSMRYVKILLRVFLPSVLPANPSSSRVAAKQQTEKDAKHSGLRNDNTKLSFARTTEPTRSFKCYSRFGIRFQVADGCVLFYQPFFGAMGCTAAIVFTCFGASYGTAKSGVGICSMGVLRPDLIVKSMAPCFSVDEKKQTC